MIIDKFDNMMQIKIVYFGPALSGKTTSLKALFSCFGKENQLKSIESSIGRTLFFDYGTISFQSSQWKLRVHTYTTTGQDFYIVTRPITLKGLDGIIFVVDSQNISYERNLTSWEELVTYFSDKLIDIPIIICFNKQDLPDKFNSDNFLEKIGFNKFKNIDTKNTIALTKCGILESFEKILNIIFKVKTPYLMEKYIV